MNKPITLYFWTTPNGFKASIMLEECGLDYHIHWIDITKGDQKKPEFLAISPNNKIPAITDPDGPDGKPVSIFESGAILQYLGRKTGKFYPRDETRRIEVEEWLFWQIGGLGPMGGQAHHYLRFAKEKIPYAIDRFREEMHRLYTVMDHRLANIRLPTLHASAGPAVGTGRVRRLKIFPMSKPGWIASVRDRRCSAA
jgi:GSH-dependent disulfide-bond oxidoreductase